MKKLNIRQATVNFIKQGGETGRSIEEIIQFQTSLDVFRSKSTTQKMLSDMMVSNVLFKELSVYRYAEDSAFITSEIAQEIEDFIKKYSPSSNNKNEDKPGSLLNVNKSETTVSADSKDSIYENKPSEISELKEEPKKQEAATEQAQQEVLNFAPQHKSSVTRREPADFPATVGANVNSGEEFNFPKRPPLNLHITDDNVFDDPSPILFETEKEQQNEKRRQELRANSRLSINLNLQVKWKDKAENKTQTYESAAFTENIGPKNVLMVVQETHILPHVGTDVSITVLDAKRKEVVTVEGNVFRTLHDFGYPTIAVLFDSDAQEIWQEKIWNNTPFLDAMKPKAEEEEF